MLYGEHYGKKPHSGSELGIFYMHHPRQDSAYHGLCEALPGMRSATMGPP